MHSVIRMTVVKGATGVHGRIMYVPVENEVIRGCRLRRKGLLLLYHTHITKPLLYTVRQT